MRNVWILLLVLLIGFAVGAVGILVFRVYNQPKPVDVNAMADQIANQVRAEIKAVAEQNKVKIESKPKVIVLKIGRFVSSNPTIGESLMQSLSVEFTKKGIKLDDSAAYIVEGICQGVNVTFGLRNKQGDVITEWRYTDDAAFYNPNPQKAAKEIADVVVGYLQSRGEIQ
jgi:hypothetical protein